MKVKRRQERAEVSLQMVGAKTKRKQRRQNRRSFGLEGTRVKATWEYAARQEQ